MLYQLNKKDMFMQVLLLLKFYFMANVIFVV